MKGNLKGIVITSLLLSITAISMYGMFKFSMIPNVNSWRLTRVAMMQAHVMASEFRQTDIGIITNLDLEAIKSKGYVVHYEILDAEPPYKIPRRGYGYFEELPETNTFIKDVIHNVVDTFSNKDSEEEPIPRGYAFYTLPVVYGVNKEFGYLGVVITRDVDEESWVKGSFERGIELLEAVVS